MPNWRVKEEYPAIKGTSPQKWAAEFLSRNPQFVSEYETAKLLDKQNLDVKNLGWTSSQRGKVLRRYGVDFPNIWGDEVSDSPLIFKTFPEWVSHVDIENSGGIFSEAAVGKSYYLKPYSEALAVMTFDLTEPILPQIERAKKMLGAQQKSYEGKKRPVGKSIVRLYPFYLRVLDAYAAQSRPAEICNILSDDYANGVSDDTLRNWKKEAERLRDGAYIEIVTNPKP